MRIAFLPTVLVQIRVTFIITLLLAMASSSPAAPTSIGASFVGRGAEPADILNPNDVAGVAPQPWWNNIHDDGVFTGTRGSLTDSAGTFTAVTLTFAASDSWNSDGPTGTPNEKLMKGIIKANPNPDTAPVGNTDRMFFTISNLPPTGVYNVIVYSMDNGATCANGAGGTNCAEMSVNLGATTYYIEQEGNFNLDASDTFFQANSTTPGVYNNANYAEFDNVSPAPDGTILITCIKNIVNPQQTDGIGVPGIQLVQVSGPGYPANTASCSITNSPSAVCVGNGDIAKFTIGVSGPCKFQWQKNGADIAGATDQTLSYIAASADNGLPFRVVVYNNVNTNTSASANLTVSGPTLTQGFLKVDRWEGLDNSANVAGINSVRTAIAGGLPTTTYYVAGGAEPQTNPNLDDFGTRITGWVKPDVTGDYRFFLRADDAAELFLNSVNGGSGTNTLPDTTEGNEICDAATPACCMPFLEPPAAQTTSTNIHLEAGKLYGMVILFKEVGGNDLVQVAWRLSTDSTPAASLKPIPFLNCYSLASPACNGASFSTQPQSTTVIQGRQGVFTVAMTTTPVAGEYGIQWYSNGNPVSGANANTYVTPAVALADDNTPIQAHGITLVGLTNSAIATLHVIPDTNAPVVTGVGTITRNDGVIQLGVAFDEPLNPSTVIPGNFTLSAGTVTAAHYVTNSYNNYAAVVIDTTGLTPGTPYTVTAHGVADPYGNAITSSSKSSTVGNNAWAESGVPIRPGQVVPVGDNGFDILNGGRKEWDSYDEITMAYVKKTNDFDVQIQVIYAEPGSEWTRVGLQARNGLDVGVASTNGTGLGEHSAYAQTHVNPNQTIGSTGLWPAGDPVQPQNTTPNNGHEQNTRLAKASATSGWQLGGLPANPPTYPNVWLRLKRVGTNIFGYTGTDGINWTNQGTVSLTDQTNVMYVGASLSVETGNIWGGTSFDVWGPTDTGCTSGCTFDPNYDRLWVAQFRNFGDTRFPISISRLGSQYVITWSVAGTLQQSPSIGTGASWTTVGGAPNTPTGGSYTNTPGATPLFFRLQQQ